MKNKPLVTFKDEGDTGPVTSYTTDARPPVNERGMLVIPLVEYGTVDLDNGVTEHGWLTIEQAARLAVNLGADFMEL